MRGIGRGESGKSGEEEWVDLMWRVVKWGEEHDDEEELRKAPGEGEDGLMDETEGVGEI